MKRSPNNPILTRADIPDVPPLLRDVSAVFNPGAIKVGAKYYLLLRVQARSRETHLMLAVSEDGEHFSVLPEIIRWEGIERVSQKIYHIYDARLTIIDGICRIVFAMDMEGGCALGLGETRDFRTFEFRGIISDGDMRNGVLFPEKIGGRYLRLDRPNRSKLQSGVATGSVIQLSESDDLLHWREVAPVMEGRWHYWDELIGSGPPPVKTREGWLHVYHGIATHLNAAIYQVGVALLDLENPARVMARSRYNILEPRELYELTGQVPNVVFPSGMIVEDFDDNGFANHESLVRIYYGAADTVVGLATSTIGELIALARDGGSLL